MNTPIADHSSPMAPTPAKVGSAGATVSTALASRSDDPGKNAERLPITMLLAFPLKIAVDNVVGNQPLPHALAMLLPGWLQASKSGNLLVAHF